MSPIKLIKNEPKVYKTQRTKPRITYGQVETKFGKSLVAFQQETLCYFKFLQGPEIPVDHLKKLWSDASFEQNDQLVSKLTENLFAQEENDNGSPSFSIQVMGTPFAMQVWETLLKIKRGSTLSYEGVAVEMGKPSATRAVASAIARNNVAYFIPCHRVISKSGAIHKYGGGTHRKMQILKEEGAV